MSIDSIAEVWNIDPGEVVKILDECTKDGKISS